jgi:hypothetical protein
MISFRGGRTAEIDRHREPLNVPAHQHDEQVKIRARSPG